MERVVSWLQNIQVRVAVTIFVVAFAFLINAELGGNVYDAKAKPIIPEDPYQRVERTSTANAQEQDGIPHPALIEKSRQQLKDRADAMRENLNLDSRFPPDTKEFLNKVEETARSPVQGIQQALEKAADNLAGNQRGSKNMSG